VFRQFFEDALTSGGALIVLQRHTGAAIGSSRFAHWNTQPSEVEIGWTFLARSCWGGKYNRELKALMLEHAFRFVDAVVFNVGAQNTRSQRAVLKLGASEATRTAGSHGSAGVRYRLTRAAYAASNAACRGTSSQT
jgi:N-acetyltransferase